MKILRKDQRLIAINLDQPFSEYPLIHVSQLENKNYQVDINIYTADNAKINILHDAKPQFVSTEVGNQESWVIELITSISLQDANSFSLHNISIEYSPEEEEHVGLLEVTVRPEVSPFPETTRGTVTTPKDPGPNPQ